MVGVESSVVHLLFSSSEAEMIEAYLNKNKHSRGGDGGGIRNTNRVEVEDEAKGKNMERLEVEADNTKDKIEEEMVIRECIETNAMYLRKI